MACYISSNENRFYAALETATGTAPAIGASHRFPAVKLTARQQAERSERRDKTGSRTFAGLPAGIRRRTSYEVTTYMTGWSTPGQEPGYGPLFRAALGGVPLLFNGGTAAAGSTTQSLRFAAPHGLAAGQAVTVDGELRFAAALADAQTVVLNAPLSQAPQAGEPVGPTVTYRPGTVLPTACIFDYWSPETAVQRVLAGAAVDKARIRINGDFHEFEFSGPASDLIDSASFNSGQAGLLEYPEEPALAEFDYSVIPGHLGQAWLGTTPDRFLTVTGAELLIDNNLDVRNREFGVEGLRCTAPGMRSVTMNFSLFGKDDNVTKELYQAARQRSPVRVMWQLGQQQWQLCGVYMPSVVPEVPEFDDSEARLEWQFTGCRAQGTLDDEVFVAFG